MTTTPARAAAIVCLLAAACAPAWAQSTPAGVWKTVDDSTKRDKSLVRIVETNGVYSGKVEKIIDPESPKDATCKECSDEQEGDGEDPRRGGVLHVRSHQNRAASKSIIGAAPARAVRISAAVSGSSLAK